MHGQYKLILKYLIKFKVIKLSTCEYTILKLEKKGMFMRKAKTKGISFSPNYVREYTYIMKIKDASKYICELIKNDLDEHKEKLSIIEEYMNKGE